MSWIWATLVVVLLGVTAAVAVGRGGAMERAYPDRPDVRMPADRPLSAEDLEDVEFSMAVRGYRMDEVDDVLRRLGTEIAERDALIAELIQPRHRAPGQQSSPGAPADQSSPQQVTQPDLDGTARPSASPTYSADPGPRPPWQQA